MSEKVIYEIGLIKEGLPYIRRQYSETDDLQNNPVLLGGFLAAIQQFVETTFNDLPSFLQMSKYVAYFHSLEWVSRNTLLYAICHRKSEPNEVKTTLNAISTKLQEFNDLIDRNYVDTEELETLNPIFDEECEKINENASERFLEWMDFI
jgi:hypothetical protein